MHHHEKYYASLRYIYHSYVRTCNGVLIKYHKGKSVAYLIDHTYLCLMSSNSSRQPTSVLFSPIFLGDEHYNLKVITFTKYTMWEQ